MQRLSVRIMNPVGLHARPAALFVNAVSDFQSTIRIRNRSTRSAWVDARSILGVLGLGVESGHSVDLTVSGPDEREAAGYLKALLESPMPDDQASR